MLVKVCGITNRGDALAAIDAGARALGFIFYAKSPRAVRPEDLEPWVPELPAHVAKVGVFVDEDPETIAQMAARLRLDIAQLHGNETPERHPAGLRVWRAFRVRPDAPMPDLHYPAEAVLLDGPVWHQRIPDTHPRILIAGGLTPENVREAIANTSPWGVDVASGIESEPGRKDHHRMKSFIQAALRS